MAYDLLQQDKKQTSSSYTDEDHPIDSLSCRQRWAPWARSVPIKVTIIMEDNLAPVGKCESWLTGIWGVQLDRAIQCDTSLEWRSLFDAGTRELQYQRAESCG